MPVAEVKDSFWIPFSFVGESWDVAIIVTKTREIIWVRLRTLMSSFGCCGALTILFTTPGRRNPPVQRRYIEEGNCNRK